VQVQQVDSSSRLRPYLPRILMAWLQESPGTIVRDVEGTVVFVDISGFTKMSERLARHGKVGAEEVTDVLGSVFARLLVVAYENGGSLVKFGGDALLLFFSDEDHEVRGARAAFGMRRELRSAGRIKTTAGLVTLRMSVGVNSGNFQLFLVGGSHKELMVAGPAATETVLMENTAEAGDILLGPSTARAMTVGALGAEKGDGVLLRREPLDVVSIPAEPVVRGDVLDLARCVPVAIREHLLAGRADPEHRQVTVAFVHFDGTDEMVSDVGDEFAAFALDGLITAVQEAADRHGVTFLGTDVDRNGGKIILVSGAPEARGDDEERMLLALREIVEADPPIPVRIGVNSGHVFVGDVGPPYRRTYTVMGDAVNLAARVMGKAEPGEILATAAVLDGAHVVFDTQPLEPFMVKGKRHPVIAFKVGKPKGSRQTDDTDRLPLVGHETELGVLLEALARAREGEGTVIELVGEAGVGKTRLLQELESRSPDVHTTTAVCEPYLSSIAFHPFHRLLRGLLSIPDDATDDDALTLLRTQVLATAPELLPWLPLIAVPFDLSVPETSETRMLEGRFRTDRLHGVIGELLRVVVTTPSLLTIEDAHWMDEASLELLRSLARQIQGSPIMICTARRDLDGTTEGLPGATTLSIGMLPPEDATMLVQLATEDAPLTPHTVQALVERAGGSPRFLRAMVFAIHQSGADVDEMPGSVEGLVTAMIDRLPRADRSRLRYLSVLGMSFSLQLASDLLEAAGFDCDEASMRRLVGLIDPDGRGGYRFRNGVTRDVAYQSLPFRRRRELHGEVGRALEEDAGADAADQAELLAFHFLHAGEMRKAWHYARVAAEQASRIYANVEARNFYLHALGAARHLPELEPLEVGSVAESLGDVRVRLGEYVEAREAYRTARRSLPNETTTAALLLKEALVSDLQGRFPPALRTLTRGMNVLRRQAGKEAAARRAEFAAQYGGIRRAQGRYEEAIRWCMLAIDEAEAGDAPAAMAHAYYVLDDAYVALGRANEAVYSPRALELYEGLGDLAKQATVMNNLGTYAYFEGRWKEAREWYERSAETFLKTGNMVNTAVEKMNVGEILLNQGRLEEAMKDLRDSLRICRASGARSWAVFAASLYGAAQARSHQFEEARAILDEVIVESREIGEPQQIAAAAAFLAELLLLEGDVEGASAAAHKALADCQDEALTPMLLRIRAYRYVQSGDLEAAVRVLEQSLAAARHAGAEHEVAFTLEAFLQCGLTGARDPDDMRGERDALFDRLGIVAVPQVPSLPVEAGGGSPDLDDPPAPA
jgi:class 3 adenylate cyclase/predicted ATPase